MGEGVRGSGDSVRVGNKRFHRVTHASVAAALEPELAESRAGS